MRHLRRGDHDGITVQEQISNEKLQAVHVVTNHPLHGSGEVYLDPNQVEYVHSRLTQLCFAFRYGIQIGGKVETTLSLVGAEALPIAWMEGDQVTLQAVVIRSDNLQYGRSQLYLSPEQMVTVRDALEEISLRYLHESGWGTGGEDALQQ